MPRCFNAVSDSFRNTLHGRSIRLAEFAANALRVSLTSASPVIFAVYTGAIYDRLEEYLVLNLFVSF